jgi:hypothetical protein
MAEPIPYGRWEPLLFSEEEAQREQAVELFLGLDPVDQRHLLRVLAYRHRRQRLCQTCRFDQVNDLGRVGCVKAERWIHETGLSHMEGRPPAEWAQRMEEWNRLQSFDENFYPTRDIPCPEWEAKEVSPSDRPPTR